MNLGRDEAFAHTTSHLLYIVGVPGSGKSTLAAALVAGRRRRVYSQPFCHTIYEDGLVQLGRERVGRSGTDTLSMSVGATVVAALEVQGSGAWPRVLGEGDRLAHVAFFEAARAAGYTVHVALLDVELEVAAARRAARGTNQNERWIKGRETKVERLREHATIVLDGARPPADLAADLAAHPVIMDPTTKESTC